MGAAKKVPEGTRPFKKYRFTKILLKKILLRLFKKMPNLRGRLNNWIE